MTLQRLFYTSHIVEAEAHRGDELAHEIAQLSAARNAETRLTGSLVFTDGQFIQVLEGEERPLEQTFERICRDFRHRNVKLVDLQLIPSRQFANWNMACIVNEIGPVQMHYEQLTEIRLLAGLNARQSIEQIRSLLEQRDKAMAAL